MCENLGWPLRTGPNLSSAHCHNGVSCIQHHMALVCIDGDTSTMCINKVKYLDQMH